MSHLPLDARAILDYLNELGYRNLSAEQLKEFMKGMQSQSEIYKSKLKEKISISQQQQQQRQQQSQSREQHRQQHQQQRQQSLQSTPSVTTKATTAEGSEAAVAGLGKTPPVPQRRATVKVIKCKKPLCHFKFYLDICDHQLTKRIEEQIRTLGGALEFFLTSSVTHFITDKAILPPIVANNSNNNNNNNNNNNSLSSRPGTPQTPGTPNTPLTPYTFDTQDGKNNVSVGSNTPTGSARKINTRQTRANAILNRVRRASTTNAINVNVVSGSEPPNSPAAPVSLKDVGKQSPVISTQSPYIVWQTEYALHFFKKVQHELKDYLGGHSRHDQQKLLGKGRNPVNPIDLKGGGFIKIEAIKRNYRPYYQLFRKSSGTEWPKIELTREDGAFRLSPKKKIALSAEVTADTQERGKEKGKARGNEEQKMTRKSRSRSSQHQRPVPAAVQTLKKSGGGVGAGAADSAATVKSSQRNSHAGAAAGAVTAGCKQVKESSEKQCGVCEICKIEYDTLTIHLKTKDHEYFAKNSQNFIALDSLIHTSADVSKFLNEDKKIDLEEMEVENIEVVADENEPDPLEGSEPLMCVPEVLELMEDKRRMSRGVIQTPSPTLREKSKRSTKGKHSSEKFQNLRLSKSPKVTATAVKTQTSPLKQQLALATATTSSMLELQRIETCTTATATSATKPASVTTAPAMATASATAPTRRKPTSAAAVSPPIRAMLPPSSLYKVVGTPDTMCTPIRKPRGDLPSGGDQAATASPSLIVKFKKVRATELHRLNGEAESFMFPKQRTSSELPTDVDRQTTSDNARASFSSISLDSTSDGPMDVELPATTANDDDKSSEEKHAGKRATVTAKRRKGQTTVASKQRFRNAPIQPEIQLKDKQVSRIYASTKPTIGNVTDTARFTMSAAAAKANAAAAALAAITLPEATRKSSRTATAIVTAATTSSRLLRAAVEAAKHNCRQMAAANELLGNTSKKCYANDVTPKLLPTAAIAAPKQQGCKRVAVVKMEDRMGDAGNDKKCRDVKNVESESKDKEGGECNDASTCVNTKKKPIDGDAGLGKNFCVNLDDDDEDDDDDEEVDNDDEKDEDYVHCKSSRRKSVSFESFSAVWQSGRRGAVSRKQRAAQREEQKSKLAMLASQECSDNSTIKRTEDTGKGGKRKKGNEVQTNAKQLIITAPTNNSKSSKPSVAACVTPTTSPPKQRSTTLASFDYASSEQIKRMRYSFERIPVSDIWYRVFTRQDNCSERFFEYYGSTNYRKLPYELGPIPFVRTLDTGVCCKLCEKQRSTEEVTKGFSKAQNVCKVKTEPFEESETGATKSRDSSSGNSNNIANAMVTSAIQNAGDVQSEQATTHSSAASAAMQYKHKHKKLQILQRYRQEQQELQKRQAAQANAQMGDSSNQLQCDSKVSTPAQEPTRDRQRAGSTHSTTSSTSCASSTATTKTSKNRYLNKHLNKAAAAFLNLELPPRKSPREHASTLALVSCIIKQRQDSQSKPNSETDEPSTTPTHTPLSVSETAGTTPIAINSTKTTAEKHAMPAAATTAADPGESVKASTSSADLSAVLRSPRHTRSAAATPVEELRFTTEISENVKRMRRGQNKYDHSPPVAPKSRKSMRGGRQPVKSPLGRPPRGYYGLQKFLHTTSRTTNRRSQTPNVLVATTAPAKRHRRVKHDAGFAATLPGARRHHSYSGLMAQGSAIPSIRKTGSKKGVLEFEVDTTAMKALDAATKHTNMRLLEWQIDKYLQLHGSEYDLAEDLPLAIREGGETVPLAATVTASTTKNNNSLTSSTSASTSKASHRVSSVNADAKRNASASTAPFDSNTPPPTDCFSSDFDLYDLFTNTTGANASEDEQTADLSNKRKSGTSFSLYSPLAMQNYFRKRKNLKSNRTGWPKVQKKKSSARQQQKLAQKIRFLQDIGELASNGIKEEPDAATECKEGSEDQADCSAVRCNDAQRRRGNGVITPPESDAEVKLYGKRTMQNNDDEEGGSGEADDDTELDAGESIPEEEDGEDDDDDDEEDVEDDGETMADSIEEEEEVPPVEGDADAALEADEEDELDGELDGDAVATAGEDEDNIMDEDSNFVPARKRTRHRTNASPLEEKQVTSNSLTAHSVNSNNTAATSTPSTQMLRGGLRRTPQLLNGSLGSCISPSEKAGDNSDIFTVSSDGLDTDLDMSNSQHKCDDEHLHHNHLHHHQHHHQDQCANHQTPKRKFDLSKYAPNNATSSSCAAEAATAAVKSLAISQFLKKEVRVTCRRLRAPFRRYRYRR